MRHFKSVAAMAIVLGLVCAGGLRAEEISPAQRMQNEAFADLELRDSKKLSIVLHYFEYHKPQAEEVVPRLLPLLTIRDNDDNDNQFLYSLTRLLIPFDTKAQAAIPQLLEIAGKAAQEQTRESARYALAAIGPNDERIFNALQKEVRAPRSDRDAVSSARALAKMGKVATRAIPDLNRQINDLEKTRAQNYGYTSDAYAIFMALGEIALKNAPLPSTRNALQTLRNTETAAPDESILAYQSLQKSGAAKSAVPLLLELAQRGPEYSRLEAIRMLGLIGPGINERTTQTLMQIFQAGAAESRFYQSTLSRMAEFALSQAKPQDAAAVPVLSEALKSANPIVRGVATTALANIGAAAAPAAANLSAALKATNEKTSDDEWRTYIRLAIAIGKDEGGLLDTIFQLLDSPRMLATSASYDEKVRVNLWGAIAAILMNSNAQMPQPRLSAIQDRIVQTLQSTLKGERPDIFLFVTVARAAGALGDNGKPMVPILISALEKTDRQFWPVVEQGGIIFHGYVPTTTPQIEAVRALGNIGKAAKPALPLLQAIADKKETDEEIWSGAESLYLWRVQAANVAMEQIRAASER